jgi:adenylosuccinate synthase
MILTKADCLAGADHFNICYGYETKDGPKTDFDRSPDFLKDARPRYDTYKGYGDISEVKSFEDLPESLDLAIEHFERFTGGNVLIFSNGPDQTQTIIRD